MIQEDTIHEIGCVLKWLKKNNVFWQYLQIKQIMHETNWIENGN